MARVSSDVEEKMGLPEPSGPDAKIVIVPRPYRFSKKTIVCSSFFQGVYFSIVGDDDSISLLMRSLNHSETGIFLIYLVRKSGSVT